MPANRSRTTQWRRCLEQIHERGGSIEIAVARTYRPDERGTHLVWRVRVLRLDGGEMIVEPPSALGRVIRFRKGIELIAILTVGQNRWMFGTSILGVTELADGARRTVGALRLGMPERVERCQRRNHYRVETGPLTLPETELWPLLDPKSVALAERASELLADRGGSFGAGGEGGSSASAELVMPEVGPRFTGHLVNIGGGGVGMRIPPEHAQALARCRLFWLRVTLTPDLPTPICASAKLVHSHMQSDQHVYAGMAFDFTFNPEHQRFVVEQISRFIAAQQQRQLEAA